MKILLSKVHSEDNFVRHSCLTWIRDFIQLKSQWNPPFPELIKCLHVLFGDKEKEIIDLANECYSSLLEHVCLYCC